MWVKRVTATKKGAVACATAPFYDDLVNDLPFHDFSTVHFASFINDAEHVDARRHTL